LAKGLDDIHPFSDTTAVDAMVRDADRMLVDEIGPKNAARIWGFISKFVMLDRFFKTLRTDFYPGAVIPRKICTKDHVGTGTKVSIYLFHYTPFC
jgi:hypothetical protein